MKQYICFTFLFLSTITSFAFQQIKGFIVLSGKVENVSGVNMEYNLSCFIGTGGFPTRQGSIVIRKDGGFYKKMFVEGNQKLSLRLGDSSFDFYVYPNDTIFLKFDNKDLDNRLTILGKNVVRTKELNFNYNFSLEYKNANLKKITREIETQEKYSDKVESLNNIYNQELNYLFKCKGLSVGFTKMLSHEIYYYNMQLLKIVFSDNSDFTTMVKNDLVTNSENNTYMHKYNYSPPQFFKSLDTFDFYNCPTYRDILINFNDSGPSYGLPFIGEIAKWEIDSNNIPDFNRWDKLKHHTYRTIIGTVKYSPARDWLITTNIIQSFFLGMDDEESIAQTIKLFYSICRSNEYRDSLTLLYNKLKKYLPGSHAPNFKLKNEKGSTISLSDFKGKVVVLDFWNTGCSPCIQDIRTVIQKVHQKYIDKDVVFVNISVNDDNDITWKNAIYKYNLGGINLIAKGVWNNKVCEAYSIRAIPHYILIDRKGNFASFHTFPDLFLKEYNILDKVLAE